MSAQNPDGRRWLCPHCIEITRADEGDEGCGVCGDEKAAPYVPAAELARVERERDELAERLRWASKADLEKMARAEQAESRVRQLEEALEEAEKDIRRVLFAGWDSTRKEHAEEGVARIRESLSAPTTQEGGR